MRRRRSWVGCVKANGRELTFLPFDATGKLNQSLLLRDDGDCQSTGRRENKEEAQTYIVGHDCKDRLSPNTVGPFSRLTSPTSIYSLE